MSLHAQTFPGIYFETVQPPLADSLPRMDIASFVGFASSGPLHTPVAVENAQQFREIFGADVSLAWDSELNQVEQSYLGLSVETFFRNGGRRCWVVRVADEDMAQKASFKISGLIRSNGTRIEPAYADARSFGGWAEGITVSSVLQSEQLQLVSNDEAVTNVPRLQVKADAWYVDVIANDTQVETGDLISINMLRDKSLLYLFVKSITDIEQGIRLSGTHGYFYSQEIDVSPTIFDKNLAISADDQHEFLLFNLSDYPALGLPDEWPQASPANDIPSVKLLRFEILTQSPNNKQQRLSDLGFVAEQNRFWGVLPSDETLYRQSEGQIINKQSAETRALLQEVSSPRLPLAAPDDAAIWHYLPNEMGFLINAANQNYAKFQNKVDRLQREGIENFGAQIFLDERLQNMRGDILKQEANEIAFLSVSPYSKKLKGIHSLLLISEATLISVPDAIHRRWDAFPPDYKLPLAAPELLEIKETEVTNEYYINWVFESNNSDKKISSYKLEWSKDPDFNKVNRINITGNTLPRVGKFLDLMPQPESNYLFFTSEKCSATYYFRVRAEYNGEVSAWSNNKAKLIPESNFLDCHFGRAQALELSLSVISTDVSSPVEEGHYLQWNLNVFESETVDYFELQRASDRLFSESEVLFRDSPNELTEPENPEFFIEDSPDAIYYYRVRAFRRETIGPWSNTLTLWPSRLSQTTLQVISEYSNTDLLAIHRALLRSCYARGDLFAVLSLPQHYEVQDSLDHYALLKPGNTGDDIVFTTDSYSAYVPALTLAEKSATTHASLYYPWLFTQTESNGLGKIDNRLLPPDGPVSGKIAAQSISQGAWIAPANSPLTDVLALENQISDSQWKKLTRSHINVIRQTSDGFVLLSANTLSTNSELIEINVRRLMSLLLRLALREGNRYLFESNNAVFQERVQQHFETVFAGLFNRGAFAGSTASQAYRVVTDSSVNTLQSIDNGRFIVELHVAPSRALKFIRVRLMQSGPGQLQVQEVT